MFIEGGCRWGFDPLWVPIDSETEAETESQEEITIQDIADAKTTVERRDAILLEAKQAKVRSDNFVLAAP